VDTLELALRLLSVSETASAEEHMPGALRPGLEIDATSCALIMTPSDPNKMEGGVSNSEGVRPAATSRLEYRLKHVLATTPGLAVLKRLAELRAYRPQPGRKGT
jgi:hypothetical protein